MLCLLLLLIPKTNEHFIQAYHARELHSNRFLVNFDWSRHWSLSEYARYKSGIQSDYILTTMLRALLIQWSYTIEHVLANKLTLCVFSIVRRPIMLVIFVSIYKYYSNFTVSWERWISNNNYIVSHIPCLAIHTHTCITLIDSFLLIQYTPPIKLW